MKNQKNEKRAISRDKKTKIRKKKEN